MAAGSLPIHAETPTARISGTVVDPVGHVLPGVSVALEAVEDGPPLIGAPATRVMLSTVTSERGQFVFETVSAGTYVITAELPGYARGVHPRARVIDGRSVDVRLRLAMASLSEVVTVVASTGSGEPIEEDPIRADFLRVSQLPADRFQEALPLLPGVIRDPSGRLSFKGTRPSQSTLLVNGTNAIDPVTGQFAVELPLSVIDTVEVHAIPHSAEFGRVSGAVVNIRTRAGDDHWDLDVGSLIPTPRFRDGTLMGISTATPRVKVSGALQRGHAWFSQAFSYRFARAQVKEEIAGDDEEIVEGFDNSTQVDVQFSDRHSMTGTPSVFPSDVDNLGIDSLDPAFATPDLESDGRYVAIADELATGPNTLWQTRFALRGFDVAVRPKGTGPSRLPSDGLRDNYFNEIDRQSRQVELSTARHQSWRPGTQEHLVKVGAQLLATSLDGIDRSGPIEMRGDRWSAPQADHLSWARRVGGLGCRRLGVRAGPLASQPRLALDLGLRYDNDAMLREGDLSPWTAFSLTLDEGGRTIIKGGWGLFFDQVFLQVDAFDRFQRRVEQEFDGTADRWAPAVVFENRVDPEGLEEPTSHVWNLEFDHQLSESLLGRVNYRENRAGDRLVIDWVTDDDGSALVLSSTGRLTGREFDATVRWTLATGGDLYASYSKILITGDINDFGLIYDNLRDPLVLANETAIQPFEAANRMLVWGVVTLPKGFTVTPGIEWRSGFPHTVFAEDHTVIGERNRAQFPRFFSADVAVTKQVPVFGRRVDLGIQAYNLTSYANPRDVVSNLACLSFGALRNSVGTTIALKLGLRL